MFDSIPELSSDLDWMLQSGQASTAMLAEALIETYYAPVYQLALGVLKDSEAANIAVQDTFVAALLNVYRYHEKDGVNVWFYRTFFDTCRRISKRIRMSRGLKFDQMPDLWHATDRAHSEVVLWQTMSEFNQNTRQIVLLRYLLEMEIPLISSVLQVPENSVRSQIKFASREFLFSGYLKRLNADSSRRETVSDSETDNLDQKLSQLFGTHYPAPDFTQEEIDREVATVLNRVNVQGARRRSLASFKELLWIGLTVGLVIGLIWVGNNLLSGEKNAQAVPAANASKIRPTKMPAPSPTPLAVTRQVILPPSPQPSSTPLPQNVFYIVQPGDTIEFIAANLGVSVDQLLHFNRIASTKDVHPGLRLVIPSSFPVENLPVATPVTPVDQSEPATPPSNSNQIQQFLRRRSANIKTVWIDAQVIHYGPEGYVGPPVISRNQLWMSDTQFLALHGTVGGTPQEVYLRRDGDLYLANPGANTPLFFPMSGALPADSSAAEDLNLLFNTLFSYFPRGNSIDFRIIGSDLIAGRKTWQIERTNSDSVLENLIWADTRTGFILRSQEFSGRSQTTVMNEVIVTAIAYNVDFPQNDLFNPYIPWRGGFAKDFSGAPELTNQTKPTWPGSIGRDALPYIPALGPLDPSNSDLSFQYPQTFSSTQSLASVSLFADKFYLGKVEFGNPWTMICDRSPDGSKIAYVSQPLKSTTSNTSLYWFDLLNVKEGVKGPLGDIHVTQLAFAPDSSRIAAFGYRDQFSTGKIYIVDLQSGAVHPIHEQGDVRSMVWSPDGKYLAFIGRNAPPQFNDQVIVLRVDTGEVTFSTSIDFQGNRGSAEWPPLKWGLDFPVEMGGLASCSLPPQK